LIFPFVVFASGFGSDCPEIAGVLYMNDTKIPHGNKKRETRGRGVAATHTHGVVYFGIEPRGFGG
jgi:hypothetical protein